MIRIYSDAPGELLAEILDAVREGEDAESTRIETWEVDENGNLRHTGEGDQWLERGLMIPVIKKRSLDFCFKPGSDKSWGSYGVLNGRLLTLLVNHFSADAQRVEYLDARKVR